LTVSRRAADSDVAVAAQRALKEERIATGRLLLIEKA